MATKSAPVNRAAVLTLWASVVARRLGFSKGEALSLARAVAGLNAYAKGRRLGLLKPHEEKAARARRQKPGAGFKVQLLGRAVPARSTEGGVRAVTGGKAINPAAVERYLEDKFGDDLGEVRSSMEALARACKPKELAGQAYALYESFRPEVPEGKRGWGAESELDLGLIKRLAKERR